jgi:DNA polymerase III epsilon subunit family exonuclease
VPAVTVSASAEQLRAVEAPLGPVLVVAGPGAGKTFCLISRIEHLIARCGIKPERICALTFTNKAAEEVAVRLRRTFAAVSEDITCGTMHSLCLRLLREFGSEMGIPEGFGVVDDVYQRVVLRRLGVPPKQHYQALVLFGRRRLEAGHRLDDRDERLFQEYVAELRRQGVLDFDDLICSTAELLTNHAKVAATVAGRWDYVLVDEFQDLSDAQYRILEHLVTPHRRLFVVGDDEQSIFSWAGADPMVLPRFQRDYGTHEPIVLDRNRRCSRQIFEAARRLLAENPTLFDKKLVADRESPFAVQAVSFPNDELEASWILQDIQDDRAQHATGWGDYAVLYRRHRVGSDLERRFIRLGIPCRLARGQALLDDPVIAYTVASLRVMLHPTDVVAVETFAERLLPRHLVERVRAAAPAGEDLLIAMRRFARRHPRSEPDTKKAWRFIYHLENLGALWRSHTMLQALVEDLLAQRVGHYRNPLEERTGDLTDPSDHAGAIDLGQRIQVALERGHPIIVEFCGGLDTAVRGMLTGTGLSVQTEATASEVGLRLTRTELREPDFPLRLFKALQWMQSRDFGEVLHDYVAFDLETTDKNVDSCEIVEIAGVRVESGEIVDRFRSLCACDRPISAGAHQVHGYRDEDLRGAPRFADVWAQFRAFVGDHVLVAHNAQHFDIPVLKRATSGLTGVTDLTFYDTLPLAKSLFRESARLVDLAKRFGVPTGRSHHALDDAETLAQTLQHLSRVRIARSRKAALSNVLDYLGLALVLGDPYQPPEGEAQTVLEIARPYALGRFSNCLEIYDQERRTSSPTSRGPSLDEVIERLGGHRLMERLRSERKAAERYPAAVARLQALIDASQAPSLEESVQRFLERVTLSSSEGVDVDPHRVNLLTLHSTKGLEFSRVYIVGVEDYHIPGYYETVEGREDAIQEARRLLYVGMTRARDRLVLTRADERLGQGTGGSRFLEEIGLKIARLAGAER